MTPTITPEVARLAEEAIRRMYAVRDEVWKSARGSNDVDVGSALQTCREAIERLAAAKQDAAPTRIPPSRLAINPTHEAANAFWTYWRENGETHRHGYYESTWGAINSALRLAGIREHDYGAAPTSASTVPADPELTSSEVNDACWAWLNAMPDGSGAYEGRIFNNLKPAIHAAICRFLAELRDPAYPPGACSVTDGEAKK